jgi:dihydroxy-acid dehydratase
MQSSRKSPSDLRSHRWFGDAGLIGFRHTSRLKQLGLGSHDFSGKPVIAIVNTWSEINSCHGHFRERAEEVKRGVWQAGGFPIELPAISLAEPFQKPSPMLYRNLLAVETEELIRSYPIDGAVLMGGCDKTTPGLIMGALSAGQPFIFFPAGPMLRGNWQGKPLGVGTDAWKYWAEHRAGVIGDAEWQEIEEGIARSAGHCGTMGTASTMTAAAEALGLTLPGASSIPAVDANHQRMATEVGRRAVEMVWEDIRPDQIVTEAAVNNAITTVSALGGSTNAIIHLIAVARRAGVMLNLSRFDEIAERVPVLADVRPAGRFLMEDFYFAGGLRAVLAELSRHLDLDALTVNGKTIGQNIEQSKSFNAEVIRPYDNPVAQHGGLAVLFGNLAPNGCVIKHTAADPKLLEHVGRAVVFDSYSDLERRIDSDDLDVTPDSVLILRNAGPLGGPGMPEWGMLPIPKKLLKQGVRDMLRISDARMSGTSYGACVLHVSPEAYIGGPLALVVEGDKVAISVGRRSLELLVSDEVLAARRANWKPPAPRFQRGYGLLFSERVNQAELGCDFDFLLGKSLQEEPEMH